MDIKPNPFSLYDFLGYLTPGAMLLYGILLIMGHADANTTATIFVSDRLSFSHLEVYIPFILAAYTTGHLLSFASSITVEQYSIWAIGYPSKYLIGLSHIGYFTTKDLHWQRKILRFLVAVILFPITLLDYLLGNLASMRNLYAKSLDPLLAALLKDKVLQLVRQKGEVENPIEHGTAKDHDYFRYAYHYAVENAKGHFPKMQNYVALFGFLRTVALLSVILFWVIFWHVFVHPMPSLITIELLFGAGFISFLFYLGFVKFYRRFSLEALMAVAVCFQGNALITKEQSTQTKDKVND